MRPCVASSVRTRGNSGSAVLVVLPAPAPTRPAEAPGAAGDEPVQAPAFMIPVAFAHVAVVRMQVSSEYLLVSGAQGTILGADEKIPRVRIVGGDLTGDGRGARVLPARQYSLSSSRDRSPLRRASAAAGKTPRKVICPRPSVSDSSVPDCGPRPGMRQAREPCKEGRGNPVRQAGRGSGNYPITVQDPPYGDDRSPGSGLALQRALELVEMVVVVPRHERDEVVDRDGAARGVGASARPLRGREGAEQGQRLVPPCAECRQRQLRVVPEILTLLG